MAILQIDLPDEVLKDVDQTEVQSLAKEALLVKLYDLGHISSGKAAAMLGVSRREFLDLLGRYNVSYFDETMNVAAEAQHG
jgi:predicted HTH domain antitoxin